MPTFTDLGYRRHLKFDGNHAQLLNGACGADATIADEGGRLAVELLEGIIQRVLQHCAVSVIVFGRDEDEPVKLGQLRRPALCDVVLWWHPGWRCRFIEEWHRVVAQVDNFDAEIGAASRNLVKPCGRPLAEAALSVEPTTMPICGFLDMWAASFQADRTIGTECNSRCP